ncbi:hypothetical protein ACFYS7_38730 [Streptomyces avermitilis]|uniref:hypothetical protein n=1 Tax=Streptomyces avermitilis TaxID=33903 RepID=UPI0036818EA5
MLNPIDATPVIRDGGAVGQYPGQIHEGVAWWLGACLVVTQKVTRIAVAHDRHPVITDFTERLCRGAINAQHYACNVRYLGNQTEDQLRKALTHFGGIPGAWLSAETANDITTVRVRLYDRHGRVLDDTTGLGQIRSLIEQDHVPIPVNEQAKGTIEPWPHELTDGGRP